MFAWPSVELTPYERKYVNVYADEKKPGVLRRAYEVRLNSLADPDTPGLENVNLSGQVQISRRSRVFALGFGGMLGSWRLNIRTASGELYTAAPTSQAAVGSSLWPIVSSMIAGSHMSQLAALKDQMSVNPAVDEVRFSGSQQSEPLLIDPNWELSPNEILIFEGESVGYSEPDPPNPFEDGQKLLIIQVHVWEFPGMDGVSDRMGAGPRLEVPRPARKEPR